MNINFNSPIGGTGYGVAGINLYKYLSVDNNVSLFPIGNPIIEDPEDKEIIQDGVYSQALFDHNAPSIKIWHQFDLANRVGKGKYYAFPFFELTLFNEREVHHLNFPDELIVSSEWAKNIVLNNKINKPIHVVPLGVDRSIFNHHLFESNQIKDKYIFFTVGKWEKRKSHDIIIELFNRAFEPTDNVELWMITHNPFIDQKLEQEWHNLAQNSKMKQHIKLFPRIKTQKELANIISYAHCGIYISRSEGWNLDMLETMSLNRPVIATNYSAHTEFCNDKNSFLVDITELEDADDNLWFHGFGQWAKIGDQQKDQVISYMKKAYNNNIQDNPEGILTSEQFSWKNSANKLLRCIA